MTESALYEMLAKIKLVAMDVDGTYTNGILYYTPKGEVIKGFHSHDGLAVELLRMAGIKRGFITGRKDFATKARSEYLHADFHLDGIGDKRDALSKLLADYEIPASDCMFIGDDLNDIKAFELAGVSVAVANANPAVKKLTDYVTEAQGGSGAIREIVDMILKAKKIDPVELWHSNKSLIAGLQ